MAPWTRSAPSPHRARPRLRFRPSGTTIRQDGGHGCLTAPSAGSGTRASPTWSSSGPATSRRTREGRRPGEGPGRSYPDGYSTELITGKIGERRGLAAGRRAAPRCRVPLENKLADADRSAPRPRARPRPRRPRPWESARQLRHRRLRDGPGCAKERVQFGSGPSPASSSFRTKLAGMLAEITVILLYCFGWRSCGQGKSTGPMASLAKMTTHRRRASVSRRPRHPRGNGLLLELSRRPSPTDMEVCPTFEGTDSIQALISSGGTSPAFGLQLSPAVAATTRSSPRKRSISPGPA